MILVEFSNSTFNLEINVKLESNVKFIPQDWINCPDKNHLPLTDTCFDFAFAAVAEGSRGQSSPVAGASIRIDRPCGMQWRGLASGRRQGGGSKDA
jgi:hypothetical protein